MYITLKRDWCTTHVIFITFCACTFFMKMHSYTIINLEYRADYLRCKKTDEKPVSPYPENINLKNFNLYMWYPVLVYELDYP